MNLMTTRRALRGRLALTAAFMLGCAPPPVSNTVQRTDSAGVEVVSIQGNLPRLTRSYAEAFVVGGAARGVEAFYEVDAHTVDVGPDGALYILDAANRRVVRFGSDGATLGAFGRPGEGPGELGQPFSLSVDDQGTVVVADRTRSGLLHYSSRGEVLDPIDVQTPFFGAAKVGIVGTLPVFVWWDWEGPASGSYRLVWGEDPPRAVASMDVTAEDAGRSFPSCPGGFTGGRYLEPGLVWATSRAGALATTTHDYEIRVFSREGRLERIIRREVEREPVAAADILEHMPDPFMANMGRGPDALCPVPLEEAVRIKGYLDRLPAINALALSSDGEIWARRGALPETAGAIDVYDRLGDPLGTLPSGTPFPVAFTPEGLASVREDEVGIQRLVAWKRR
jgi:hypothetical protein